MVIPATSLSFNFSWLKTIDHFGKIIIISGSYSLALLSKISKNFKNLFAIQGNLDPKVLLKADESIWEATQRICNIMKEYPGFIFNLGHGILHFPLKLPWSPPGFVNIYLIVYKQLFLLV